MKLAEVALPYFVCTMKISLLLKGRLMLTDKFREWEGGQVSESQGGSHASPRLGSQWAYTESPNLTYKLISKRGMKHIQA